MEQQTLPLPSDRKVKRLSLKEQHALNTFTQAEYVQSKLTDVDFAEKAAAFLNLPGLNARHIASSREIFEIPSNRDVARAEKTVVQMKLDTTILDKFDARLETVEKQVRKLFALSDGTRLEISDAAIVLKREELYRTHSAESGDARAIALVRWALAGGK